jgi:hypothetical protein
MTAHTNSTDVDSVIIPEFLSIRSIIDVPLVTACNWKQHPDGCTDTGAALHQNCTIMGADDTLRRRHSQPSPCKLGRKERIEELIARNRIDNLQAILFLCIL